MAFAVRGWLLRTAWAAILAGTIAMGQAHYRFADYAVVAGGFTLAAALQRLGGMGRAGRIVAITGGILLAGSYYAIEMLDSVFDIDVEHPSHRHGRQPE